MQRGDCRDANARCIYKKVAEMETHLRGGRETIILIKFIISSLFPQSLRVFIRDWFFIIFFCSSITLKKIIGVQLFYNVVSVSSVQQSESVKRIHISPLFGFSSLLGHHRTLSGVPCAIYRSFSLVIYFTHCINSVYMSTPISQSILPRGLSYFKTV